MQSLRPRRQLDDKGQMLTHVKSVEAWIKSWQQAGRFK